MVGRAQQNDSNSKKRGKFFMGGIPFSKSNGMFRETKGTRSFTLLQVAHLKRNTAIYWISVSVIANDLDQFAATARQRTLTLLHRHCRRRWLISSPGSLRPRGGRGGLVPSR